MSDRDLREFREAFRDLQGESADPSLPDDAVAGLVTDDLTDEAREALIERLLDSPDAVERFRDVLALHRAAEQTGDISENSPAPTPLRVAEAPTSAPPEARRSASRIRRAVGLAAGLILGAVLIGRFADRTAPPQPAIQRSLPAATATITSALETGASLPREAFVLEWRLEGERREGVTFDLLVSRASERLAGVQGLVEPRHRLDRELDGVTAGEPIYFRVTARFVDGRKLESDTFVVSVE